MRVAERLTAARLIYFSGITLSLYSAQGLGRFLAVLEVARQQGAKVAFDGNFRPRAWKGDLQRTRTVFIEALKRVDIALPAFDDEAVLWGDPSPESTVERLQAFGIGEIVVKNGPNSRAGREPAAARNSCRCPKCWFRSTSPPPATRSMPAISRRGCRARFRCKRRAPRIGWPAHVIRHPGALLPRSRRPRCIRPLRILAIWPWTKGGIGRRLLSR